LTGLPQFGMIQLCTDVHISDFRSLPGQAMPRIPRKLLIDPTEVAVFHCISRCVRRAFLCGEDRITGRNYDYRRQWIQDRLAFLAGQFGIDLLGFAVMANHLHVVLRNRPDVVETWSDEEVARRWWNLFPLRRDDEGAPAEPEAWELSLVTGSPERLAEIRRRLSSLSWFMRCVAEPIARRANREDRCTGRFWEGRYKCQPLLDEAALAACLAYIDLNPIRAGIAVTPEESRFTSAYERIAARKEAGANDSAVVESPATEKSVSKETPAPRSKGVTESRRDDWLSPLELSEEGMRSPVPQSRASNTGCLPMCLDQYLELLDWTGRQVRQDKRGAIPEELAPILQRIGLPGEAWLHLVTDFARLFRRSAGTPASLRRDAEKRGRRRAAGIGASTQLFG